MGENVVDVDAIRERILSGTSRADVVALCDAVDESRAYAAELIVDRNDAQGRVDWLTVDNERLLADLLAAADALGPMVPGAKVGGRGVAMTAKAAVDEVLRLRAVIAEVEKVRDHAKNAAEGGVTEVARHFGGKYKLRLDRALGVES